MLDELTYDQLEARNPNVLPGGRYFPKNCKAKQKIAIIIPYRDRELHLRVFLLNMHPFLMQQQLDYGIYVIEQVLNYYKSIIQFMLI